MQASHLSFVGESFSIPFLRIFLGQTKHTGHPSLAGIVRLEDFKKSNPGPGRGDGTYFGGFEVDANGCYFWQNGPLWKCIVWVGVIGITSELPDILKVKSRESIEVFVLKVFWVFLGFNDDGEVCFVIVVTSIYHDCYYYY